MSGSRGVLGCRQSTIQERREGTLRFEQSLGTPGRLHEALVNVQGDNS